MVKIVTSKTEDLRRRVEDEYLMHQLEEEVVALDDPLEVKVPSLYVVLGKNPYVPIGRYMRRFEDGYEECIVGSPNGHLRILGYRGIVWPHRTLGQFLLAIRDKGFDWGSERMDRRRVMAQVGG